MSRDGGDDAERDGEEKSVKVELGLAPCPCTSDMKGGMGRHLSDAKGTEAFPSTGMQNTISLDSPAGPEKWVEAHVQLHCFLHAQLTRHLLFRVNGFDQPRTPEESCCSSAAEAAPSKMDCKGADADTIKVNRSKQAVPYCNVSFSVCCAETQLGEELRVVGSVPELGCWDVSKAPALTTDSVIFPFWTTPKCLELPTDTDISYKYVKVSPSSDAQWESALPQDRKIRLPSQAPVVYPCIPDVARWTATESDMSFFKSGNVSNLTTSATTPRDPSPPSFSSCGHNHSVKGDAFVSVEDTAFNVPTELSLFSAMDISGFLPLGGIFALAKQELPESSAARFPQAGPCVWTICGAEALAGEWSLLFDRSDSLSPLMEATGVSWLVRSAVKMTTKYLNSIRVIGSRVIVKTMVSAGDNSQTTHTHGNIHFTKELDGDIYATVSGWDIQNRRLLTVRHHPTKGVIRQIREVVIEDNGNEIQHSNIKLILPNERETAIDLNLYFERVEETS